MYRRLAAHTVEESPPGIIIVSENMYDHIPVRKCWGSPTQRAKKICTVLCTLYSMQGSPILIYVESTYCIYYLNKF